MLRRCCSGRHQRLPVSMLKSLSCEGRSMNGVTLSSSLPAVNRSVTSSKSSSSVATHRMKTTFKTLEQTCRQRNVLQFGFGFKLKNHTTRNLSSFFKSTINRTGVVTIGGSSVHLRSLTTSREKRKLTLEDDNFSSTPPNQAPSSSSSSMLPFAAVGAAAVGGGASYYYYINNLQASVPEKDELKSMAAYSEESAGVQTTTEENQPPGSPSSNHIKSEQAPASSEPTTSATTPRRVSRIDVPPKMKNTSSDQIVSTVSHPVGGHRVSVLIPSVSSSTDSTDSLTATENASEKNDKEKVSSDVRNFTMTEAALAELKASIAKEATTELLSSHVQLSTYIEDNKVNWKELDAMSDTQLKLKIVQLTSELKDRTAWEAVRLKEFLAMKEKETSNKYLEILQKQRLEFEDLLATKLREQENTLQRQMHNALQAKDDSFQSLIDTALSVQRSEHEADKKASEELFVADLKAKYDLEYSAKFEEFKSSILNDLQRKVQTLENLRQQVDQLQHALQVASIGKEGSAKAHRLSATALALADRMEGVGGSTNAAAEIRALKEAAGKDGVISTAVSTIPEQAMVGSGVPTLAQLQARFDDVVYKNCRQATLVPAGRPGLGGQIAGIFFAALKYPPSLDESDEQLANDPEYIVERARSYVKVGDMERAVDELEKLALKSSTSNGNRSQAQTQAALVVRDWKKDAINRITIEKAMKVIKMECALLNESCLSQNNE